MVQEVLAHVPDEQPASAAAGTAHVSYQLPDDLTRIKGLYIGHSKIIYQRGTNIGEPINEPGLFTEKEIKQGAFVMFYTGAFYEKGNWKQQEKNYPNLTERLDKYAISTKSRLVHKPDSESPTQVKICAPPPPTQTGEDDTGPPDFKMYPGSAINEPNKDVGATANVYAYDITVGHIIGQGPGEDVSALPAMDDDAGEIINIIAFPIFACRDIAAGEELLWNYGPGYDEIRAEMGYEAGAGCFDSMEDVDMNKLLASHDLKSAKQRMRSIWQFDMQPGQEKQFGTIPKKGKVAEEFADFPTVEVSRNGEVKRVPKAPELNKHLIGFRASNKDQNLTTSTQALSLKAANLPNPNRTQSVRSTRGNTPR